MRFRFRYEIPLIGGVNPWIHAARSGQLSQSDIRKITWDAHLHSLASAVLKPGRQLGGPWIDGYVSQRMNVIMCENCRSKYGVWWKKYGYHPAVAIVSDCDGCGATVTPCVRFLPDDREPDYKE